MQKQTHIIFLFVSLLLLCTVNADAQKRNTNKTTTAKKKNSTIKKKTTTITKTNKTTTVAPKDSTTVAKVSKDTSKPDVVIIYAAFKPSLRNAAKLNFTAATPVIDTTRFTLNYVVPAQNLFFSYQPVPLKPLALFVDENFIWTNNQYIKAGFGGYTTPYLETGLSFGDGKKMLTNDIISSLIE